MAKITELQVLETLSARLGDPFYSQCRPTRIANSNNSQVKQGFAT